MNGMNVVIFDIETTNSCNATCLMCPRDELKRPKGNMSAATFSEVVNKINEFNINFVVFSGFGEPLLNKNTIDYIKMLGEKSGCGIQLNSNGGILNQSTIDRLLGTKLSGINLNVNAIDKENYSRIVPEIDFDVLLENIDYLVKKKKEAAPFMEVSIQTSLLDMNSGETKRFCDFWFERGIDKITVQACNNRGGFYDDSNMKSALPGSQVQFEQRYCNLMLFIAWNGYVFPCSHDLHGKYSLGHVQDMNREWLSKKQTPMCADCDLTNLNEVRRNKCLSL